jgi:hypothetical protein
MTKESKQKDSTYSVNMGTYLTKEQDDLLRLYARANNTLESVLLRDKIIIPWIKRHKLNKEELITQILERVQREWEIQKLKNLNNPSKTVPYCDFLKAAKFSFRRLPRDVVEYLMNKLQDGENEEEQA